MVLVQEVGTPHIFDVGPLRYVDYRKQMIYQEVLEDQDKIAATIRATREATAKGQNVNSIVKFLSLTRPAQLANVPEDKKEYELLQVIMTELGSIRAEMDRLAKVVATQHHKRQRKSTQLEDPEEYLGASSNPAVWSSLKTIEKDLSVFRSLLEQSSSTTVPKAIPQLIQSNKRKLDDLKSLAVEYGDDDSSEYIALLDNQIKVLLNICKRRSES